MLRVIVLHHSGRQTNRKSVPVGSCRKIIKNFPVPVCLLIIPIEIHDRISIQGAERVHPHRNSTVRQTLRNHIALRSHRLLSVQLRCGGIQQKVHRDIARIPQNLLLKYLVVIQIQGAPDPVPAKLSCR